MDNAHPIEIASETNAILGPVTLLAGENRAAYEALLARVTAALKPADILEEIWVRDVVDLVWDALRMRRMKANLLTASAKEGMGRVLCALDVPTPWTSSKRWLARDPEAVAMVESLLAAAGLSLDSVLAQTLSAKMDDVDRIERMTMAAEGRRNAALHEIDRYRATLAQPARPGRDPIETAEYNVITANAAPALVPPVEATA
jgi:hypothetical protein